MMERFADTHWTGSGSIFDIIESVSTVNDGNWHHVAVTHNQGTFEVNIYVDGILETTTSSTTYHSAMAYDRLGGSYTDGTATADFFQGQLDEIRIWDNVRTVGDIQSGLYAPLSGSEAGLMAYYRFDETSGTVLPDLAGLNDGTLTNMTGSEWVPSGAFTDITGPVLSNYVESNISYNQVDFSIDVNELSDVYYVVTESAVAPTNTQVRNGQNESGASVTLSGSFMSVSAKLTQFINGLMPSTSYYIYFVAEDQASNLSSVYQASALTELPPPNALDFDGSGDFLEASNIDGLSAMTVEAWIYLNATSNNTIAAVYNSNVSQSVWFMEVNSSNKLNFSVSWDNSNYFILTSTATIPLNSWVHVAAVWSGNANAQLYINGIADPSTPTVSGSAQSTLFDNSVPLTVGALRNVGGSLVQFFNGRMDEFRIWNSARTTGEIRSNISIEIASPLSESNLITYYSFNQGVASGTNTGITLELDRSTSGNDGTLNGFLLTGGTSNYVDSDYVSSTQPEVNLKFDSNPVANGATIPLGFLTFSAHSFNFTIENTGIGNLDLTGTPFVSEQADNADFAITGQPGTPISPFGESIVNFDITPGDENAQSVTLDIPNNDSDENPYTLTFTWTGDGTDPVITVDQLTTNSSSPTLTEQSMI